MGRSERERLETHRAHCGERVVWPIMHAAARAPLEWTTWLARTYWSSDLGVGVLWRTPDDCGLEKLDEHIVVSTVHE